MKQGTATKTAFFVNCFLILLAVFTGFALVEGFLYFWHKWKLDSPLPYAMRQKYREQFGGMCMQPDFTGKSKRGIEYKTNALGFRDDPIDPASCHVIFLGDSTTFGLNITHEDSYPEKVKQILLKAGYRVQSLNTATPAQGTISELYVLEWVLNQSNVHPRAVVLGFFPNDFSDNVGDESHLIAWKGGQRSGAENPLCSRPEREASSLLNMFWNSRTVAYLRFFVAYMRGKHKMVTPKGGSSPSEQGGLDPRVDMGSEVEHDWLDKQALAENRSFKITVSALGELSALCAEKNLKLIFLALPGNAAEVMSVVPAPLFGQALRDYLSTQTNVLFVDVLSLYQDYLKTHNLSYLPEGFYSSVGDMGHPGPLACSLIAAKVAELILVENLVAPCRR